MVLLDAQVVGGDARVLAAVLRLGHVDLQGAIFVDHVGVFAVDADQTILEPMQKQMHLRARLFLGGGGGLNAKEFLPCDGRDGRTERGTMQ